MSTNGTITVDIDPNAPMPARYLGSDEDGPHYAEMTLYDAIAESAAAKIVKSVDDKLKNDITERITEKIGELVDAKIPELFEQALDAELVVTDRWGNETKQGTLRELIVNEIQGNLRVKKPDGFDYERSALDEVVKKHIRHTLTSDLSKAVDEAKAELTKKLRDEAGRVMADTIAKAVR